MAFPTTSLLSSFTGADEDPLSEGGAWLGTLRVPTSAIKPCRRVSNTAGPSGTTTTASESIYGVLHAADQEVWGTIAAVPSGTDHIAFYARAQNVGLFNVQTYLIIYIVGTGVQFYKLTYPAGYVQIGATVAGAMSAGHKLGMSVIGTTLEGWKDTGGGWTSIGTRVDSAISGSGYTGIWMAAAGETARVDNFGGGAVPTGQVLVPDADNAAGNWGTSPLFSKVNDSLDSTVISATSV